MKKMIASVCLLAGVMLCLTGAVQAGASDARGISSTRSTLVVLPGKVHEIYMPLVPGEQLHYAFTASDKLSFNLHYHAGHKVAYPVPEQLVSTMKESFIPESVQEYCLMWTNQAQDSIELVVEYEKDARKE